MSDNSTITFDCCDQCGQKSTGTLHTHRAAPVVFVCKHCAPKGFESQAREDIDRWLAGGSV